MQKSLHHLKQAQKASLMSICTYIIIACVKLFVGILNHSHALVADGLNNITDILSSLVIYIGLKIAQKPADDKHQYGHWKAESIASLIGSFIMLYIGLQVLHTAIESLFSNQQKNGSIIVAVTGFITSIIVFILYYMNIKLAKKTNSLGLLATAKNNLSDAIASLLTAISISISLIFQWYWLDSVLAIVISLVILKTGLSIFIENVFNLSDGFERDLLEEYRHYILSNPHVKEIKTLKARRYGANIYVDVTILLDGHLSVYDSHAITEDIEYILYEQCDVVITDVHVEPLIPNETLNNTGVTT